MARALGCVLVLLTASTALADLESVLKAATKFEDGWAIKLDRALKAEGADVNLLVEDPNNAGNMVTPLLVVLKAIAERKGGFAIFTNLLAHKDIDLNIAGKAPNGEKMTPILYAILFAVHADTGHGDENIGKHKHDSIHAAGALLARKEVNLSGQKMSLLGMALSAYAAGQLRGLAVAKMLMKRDEINVNELTYSDDGSQVSPIGVMVTAVATQGGSAGLEFAGELLQRADLDLHVKEVMSDGSITSPLKRCLILRKELPDNKAIQKLLNMMQLREIADDPDKPAAKTEL